MLTPSILTPVTPFYAIGNTPAVSLTRCLPQGVDADILLLGCGDVRHILNTAYTEKGFRKYYSNPSPLSTATNCFINTASRKLDITCCDIEDAIIG